MTQATSPDSLAALGLPQIDQVGFVVRSVDEARERYGAFFGPFTTLPGSVQGCDYRGRKADAELAIICGRSGDVEMEFIEWLSGESPHREFIEQGREGMHHIRYSVDDPDAWIENVAPLGYRPIWYKVFSPDTTFVYLEREGDPLLIEFLKMPPGGPGSAE